jgi:PncC family amidohydrolase
MPGVDAQELTAQLHAELVERQATIATAESLTGGALGDLLSAAPGASDSYLGGVVSYATTIKQKLLGVTDATVEEHGVVSAECAEEMARGVRELVGADFAVSTTGVAGPSTQDRSWAEELHLDGDRPEIRERTCLEAVRLALQIVVKGDDD